MYNGLGIQWATTLVAFLTLVCVPIPFVFYFKGSYIRSFSKHAPTGRNLNAKSSSNLEQPQRKRSLSGHDQKLANIQEADHDDVPAHSHPDPAAHV